MLRLVIDKGIPEDKTYHVTFFPVDKEFDKITGDFLKKVHGEYVAAPTIAECLKYTTLPSGFSYAWHFFHPKLKKIHDFPEGFEVSEVLVERMFGAENPYAGSEPGRIEIDDAPGMPVGTADESPAGGDDAKEIVESLEDNVNHPSRYTSGAIECIDALESAVVEKDPVEAIYVANVIKYLWRYEKKEPLRSLMSAQWYLNRLVEKAKVKYGE